MIDASEVTISLLVYGPSPWLADVVSALRANTPRGFQLIVVDNGTTDEVRAFLATVTEAQVERPGRNLGFGVGHTYAANLARGRYFVTLNSDALVPRGWLDSLVAPLATDPAIGATMPVYVYPDGRLQEAGAAVEPSGQVIAFGRFADPKLVEHRVSGPVPFASAACMATPTATFRALGGFDARYGVAYYEDVDYVFALHANGLRVELVAGVRVVHAQGASSATAGDAERMLLGNRARFQARYAPWLTGRPDVFARPEAHHLAAARDYDSCDRVLVIAAELQAPGEAGNAGELVAALQRRLHNGRVTVAVAAGPRDAVVQDAWLARGVEIVTAGALAPFARARRFHYAAIVTVPPVGPDPAGSGPDDPSIVLHDTQPQAAFAEAPGPDVVDRPSAFDSWLGSIDLVARIAPPTTLGALR